MLCVFFEVVVWSAGGDFCGDAECGGECCIHYGVFCTYVENRGEVDFSA